MNQSDMDDQKKVGFGLFLGILLLPWLFAWFTLREGYSARARYFAFGWAALIAVGPLYGFLHSGTPAPEENKQLAEAALARCPPVGAVGMPASSASRFQVNFSITVQGDSLKPIIVGRTNLPPGTKFLVTLTRPITKYMGQADAVVATNGCFSAGPFGQGNGPLNGGSYDLELNMASIGLQPETVRQILGDRGKNLLGPAVERLKIGNSDFGKTVHYRTTIDLGSADAAKDQAARTAAEAQEEKRYDNLRGQSAILAARTLRRNLRNPASADWVSVDATRDGSVVCMVLRAQNGFGGMSVDNYVSTDGTIRSGAAAWNKYCAGKSLYSQTRLIRAIE